MPHDSACLGLSFFDHQLFYATSKRGQEAALTRIGAVDFNFNVPRAILTAQKEHLQSLTTALDDLKDRFNINQLRVLLYPTMECWSILPKLVYDDAEEREAHIGILLNSTDRKHIHPAWHTLSKDNFKLLKLRTDDRLRGIKTLTNGTAQTELVSAFEVGENWITHARPGGSFMTVGCFNNTISVSSFILGNLRGATYITFDDPEDLPYLWLQQAQALPWMHGLHEQVQVYGSDAWKIIEILQPFWDDAGSISKMDTLEKMQVTAREQTYGFNLELAYPAIMLALG